MRAARLTVHELERRVLVLLVLLAAVGTAAVLSLGPRASAASVPASATAPGVAGVSMGAGGETWFLNLSASEQASWISTMVSDGVKWLRIDSPGNLAGWYNTEISDAEAAGINVDALIETWGMSSVTPATMGPMCTGQVDQLEPLGVQTYEVINEPNVNGYTAAEYEPLLAACYSAIKAVDPSATVLSGGLAVAGGSEAAATYLAAIYAANGGTSTGLFDGMGMHVADYDSGMTQTPTSPADCPSNEWNPFVNCPPSSNDSNNQQQMEISSVRTVMDDNGDSGKAIWFTEFDGCPTGTDGGYTAYCDDAQLATQITGAYQQVHANPDDEYGLLGPMFFYDWIDTNSTDDANGSGYDDFGLYDDTGTAKTGVVSAFQAGAALAGSSTSTTTATADPPPTTTTTADPPPTTTTTTTTTDPPPTTTSPPASSGSAGAVSAVGSLVSSLTYSGSSGTLAVDPQASGDALVLAVSAGAPVSSVSGGGATWSQMVEDHDTSAGWYYELWLGTVTEPGASTITVSLTGSAGDVELGAQEFSSSYGAATTWSVDKTGMLHNFWARTITYPSLAPAQSPELYFGFANVIGGGSSPQAGTSAGFTYADLSAATLDQVAYNGDVTGAVQPTSTSFSHGSTATVAVLLRAT